MESASKVYIASAKIADILLKGGVKLIDQGVVVNSTRCFVFEVKPENMQIIKKVLGNAYKG